MRVVVNELATLGRRTGVGHTTAELVRALRRLMPPGTLTGFPDPLVRRARQAWGWLRARRAGKGGSPGGALHNGGRSAMRHYFRAVCRLRRFDLYHEPNFLPLPCDLPTVATLHDLSVLLHPEWHPAERVAAYERDFRDGLARTRHVITVSEFARQEIIRVLGVPPGRVTRVYNGVSAAFSPRPADEVAAGLRRLGLPPEYFLYVGTLEPRKNLLTLVRAYCALPDAVRRRFPLLLAGGWGWRAESLADYLKSVGEARGVRHVGYVADGDLPVLYNGARALAFPSLYEGFGLPPLEMLACGGAVLASTAGAVAETAGAAAHLTDPHDEPGWRDALLRVATDDDWWHELRRGATSAARPFTWERSAADTLGVYRDVLGLRPAAHQPLAA
ncbi:MAG TPA: glycosyltransferase family 1 protein [Gemmataceae bacterium]|nr:glycosyltransferase family 1 protein [Gemmataceae bacterium]